MDIRGNCSRPKYGAHHDGALHHCLKRSFRIPKRLIVHKFDADRVENRGCYVVSKFEFKAMHSGQLPPAQNMMCINGLETPVALELVLGSRKYSA